MQHFHHVLQMRRLIRSRLTPQPFILEIPSYLGFDVEVEIFVHFFASLSIKHCKIDRSVRKRRSKNHVVSECLSHPNSFKMEASLRDIFAPHIPEKVQLSASALEHRGGTMPGAARHTSRKKLLPPPPSSSPTLRVCPLWVSTTTTTTTTRQQDFGKNNGVWSGVLSG